MFGHHGTLSRLPFNKSIVMTLDGFSKQIYFFWPRQIQKNIGKVFKKPQPPKKVNKPSDRKLKTNGSSNSKPYLKNEPFSSYGPKRGFQKGLNPYVCLNFFLSYTHVTIKKTNMVIFSICPGVTFQ